MHQSILDTACKLWIRIHQHSPPIHSTPVGLAANLMLRCSRSRCSGAGVMYWYYIEYTEHAFHFSEMISEQTSPTIYKFYITLPALFGGIDVGRTVGRRRGRSGGREVRHGEG